MVFAEQSRIALILHVLSTQPARRLAVHVCLQSRQTTIFSYRTNYKLYRLRTYFPNLPSYPLIPSSCYRNIYKSAGNVQKTITTTSGYTPPRIFFFRVMLIDANNRSSKSLSSQALCPLAIHMRICNLLCKRPHAMQHEFYSANTHQLHFAAKSKKRAASSAALIKS